MKLYVLLLERAIIGRDRVLEAEGRHGATEDWAAGAAE